MKTFELETKNIEDAANRIYQYSSLMLRLSESVNNLDTTCDEFGFTSAKSVISKSIKNCANIMDNTSRIMSSVVTTHESIQKSMKIEYSKIKW